jgi:WD repeat-containing protein 40A
MATGAADVRNVALFDLPSHRPLAVLEGHSNWVFAGAFVDDRRLLTASRDGTVKFWRLPDSVVDLPQPSPSPSPTDQSASIEASAADSSSCYDSSAVKDTEGDEPTTSGATATTTTTKPSSPVVVQPRVTRCEHQSKVRDLQLCRKLGLFATVSEDRTLKFWDMANLDVVGTVRLSDCQDLMSIAFNDEHNMLAIACHHAVSLVDVRSPMSPIRVNNNNNSNQRVHGDSLDVSACVTKTVVTNDGGVNGIRSVRWCTSSMLTFGSGHGHLSFYDITASRFLDLSPSGRSFLEAGEGFLERDAIYRNYFHERPVPNSIYAHELSPNRTKMLMSGGPLMAGLKGWYVVVLGKSFSLLN